MVGVLRASPFRWGLRDRPPSGSGRGRCCRVSTAGPVRRRVSDGPAPRAGGPCPCYPLSLALVAGGQPHAPSVTIASPSQPLRPRRPLSSFEASVPGAGLSPWVVGALRGGCCSSFQLRKNISFAKLSPPTFAKQIFCVSWALCFGLVLVRPFGPGVAGGPVSALRVWPPRRPSRCPAWGSRGSCPGPQRGAGGW